MKSRLEKEYRAISLLIKDSIEKERLLIAYENYVACLADILEKDLIINKNKYVTQEDSIKLRENIYDAQKFMFDHMSK